MVVGTAPDPADGRLAAVAVRAPGVPAGLLRSGTTQRTGFVQLMDVAPSVLDLARHRHARDHARSVRSRSTTGPGDAHARQHFLVDADEAAAFRAEIQQPVASVFLATVVVLLGLGLAALRRPGLGLGPARVVVVGGHARVPPRRVPRARGAVPRHRDRRVLGVDRAGLGGARGRRARTLGHRHATDPAIGLLAITVLVLGADVVLGSPLQFNGALGYSPEVAGRFIGFGNAGFAVFGASALFLACLIAARGGAGARTVALAILARRGPARRGAPVGCRRRRGARARSRRSASSRCGCSAGGSVCARSCSRSPAPRSPSPARSPSTSPALPARAPTSGVSWSRCSGRAPGSSSTS